MTDARRTTDRKNWTDAEADPKGSAAVAKVVSSEEWTFFESHYYDACCDCGLAHRVDVRATHDGYEVRNRRMDEYTAELRAQRDFPLAPRSAPEPSDGAIYTAGSQPMPQELADHIADAGKMVAPEPDGNVKYANLTRRELEETVDELGASVERGREVIEALRSFINTDDPEISVSELDWAAAADNYLAGEQPATKDGK